MRHMGGGGHHIYQTRDIGRSPNFFHSPFFAQARGDGQNINRLAMAENIQHGLINFPMSGFIKSATLKIASRSSIRDPKADISASTFWGGMRSSMGFWVEI